MSPSYSSPQQKKGPAATNNYFQQQGGANNRSSSSQQQPPTLETALLQISYKDYKSALKTLKILQRTAPQDSAILYHLGHCYLHLHQYKDAEKAYLMSGTPQALFECYELYLDQKQYEAALEILKKSQSIEALLELVRILEDVFHPLYRYRTKVDFGKVKCLLGTRYLLGEDGLEVNEKRALQLYKESAELNYASGFTGLAYMYEHGLGGLETDMTRAIELYTDAAEKGCVRAMGNLGNCYLEGVGVPINEKEALKWLSKAAKEGDTDSMTALGMYYAKKQEEQDEMSKAATQATPALIAPPQTAPSQPAPPQPASSQPAQAQQQPPSGPSTVQPQSAAPNYNSQTEKQQHATPQRQQSQSSIGSKPQQQQQQYQKQPQIQTPDPRTQQEENATPPTPVLPTTPSDQIKTPISIPESSQMDSVYEDRPDEEDVVTADVEALEDEQSTQQKLDSKSRSKRSTRRNPRKSRKRANKKPLQPRTLIVASVNGLNFFLNLIGMTLSLAGVAVGICMYTLYSKDYRFTYIMGASLVSFCVHVLTTISSLFCYMLVRAPEYTKSRIFTFLNLVISFGCMMASFSFAGGVALMLGILHVRGTISLSTWA